MKQLFDKSFFEGNRTKLRAIIDSSTPIVITANGLLQRNSDVTYPFRQESNFWYLTGVNEPNFSLVLDGGDEFLIAPASSDYQRVMESAVDLAEISKTSGLKIYEPSPGWQKLTSLIKKQPSVSTIKSSGQYHERFGFFTNPARHHFLEKLKQLNNNLEIQDIRTQLAELRMVKQPQELAAIKRAIKITAEAIDTVRGQIDTYQFEHEVEAEITGAFKRNGASHAFDPIIAAGLNAATIHYKANNQEIKKDWLLLLDIGAEVENYAADITRVIAVGTPTKRQIEIFDVVKEVHQFAINELKAGVLFSEYELAVEGFMGQKLRQLKIITATDRKTIRRYYPHGTSHFLGLDTHDVGDYHQPLKEGSVITVEPGIYIPEEGIGIRLEDDVLVTKTSVKVLSSAIELQLS